MPQVYTSNISEVISALRMIVPQVERDVTKIIRGVCTYINTEIHKRVPVYSGRAVRNMIWSMGTPNDQEIEPIAAPTDPGPTATMAVGQEPRRAANEAAAKETFDRLIFKRPFGTYWLSNNAKDIVLIEYGLAPGEGRQRTPAGAFRLTVADAVALMKAGAF